MSKNPIVKIRLKILRGLAKIPMTTYDVREYVGCSYDTAKKHLFFLEKLGKVEQIELKSFDPQTERNKIMWQLRKKMRGGESDECGK